VSVLSAVTVQNTRGVREVLPLPPDLVGAQLAAVLDDLPVVAVKVGMLPTPEIAAVVAERAAAGALPRLVLDPVLASTRGDPLGDRGAVELLLPYAAVVTPNLAEATALTGSADPGLAAAALAARGARCVVVTGGDSGGSSSVDTVWAREGIRSLRAPRVTTGNTHGTGCTFSSAVAARLALGDQVLDAVVRAKQYVTGALCGAAGWTLGGGNGPLDHFGFGEAT
jgi:hydroxymethylpyrimidine kinase/phosphomethylpyrimidine kinase